MNLTNWTDVPAQFLPWLRPGSLYSAENILTNSKRHSDVQIRVEKHVPQSFAHCQEFGPHPLIQSVATFLNVDSELFAHFLLKSPVTTRQFFNWSRRTVLLYVYYTDQEQKFRSNDERRVNDVITGYSYLVAFGELRHSHDDEKIRLLIERENLSNPIFQNCQVLLNWTPSTVEKLRDCVNKVQCGVLFFKLKNLKPLHTSYEELTSRVINTEYDVIHRYSKDDRISKSWTLAEKLISNYPCARHFKLLDCFRDIKSLDDFYATIGQYCSIKAWTLFIGTNDQLAVQRLYNEILSLRPIAAKKSVGPDLTVVKQPDLNNLSTPKIGSDLMINPKQPAVSFKNKIAMFNSADDSSASFNVKQTKSNVGDKLITKSPVEHQKTQFPIKPEVQPHYNPNFPKTVVRIPRGSLEFWKKVFDGDDVFFEEQNGVCGVTATTIRGEKLEVQLIQPRRLCGISVVNKMDNSFKKSNQRFVCQFCANLVRVHSEDSDLVYCGCGKYKTTDFIAVHLNIESQPPHLHSTPDNSFQNSSVAVAHKWQPTQKNKMEVTIPRGSLTFWQKVFEDFDVVIKQSNVSDVNMTTTTGKKRVVQLIQPVQFCGISDVNEIDTMFKKNNVLFVCQFCATFLKAHCANDDILYCRCGKLKNSKFIPAYHNFESVQSKLFSDSKTEYIEMAGTLLVKCAKALMKFSQTNTHYSTANHLIGVLASSFNGKVQKAREIAQAVGITEDVKLLTCQQLAFFRQLTQIEEFLNDRLSQRIKNYCDIYEPFFVVNI